MRRKKIFIIYITVCFLLVSVINVSCFIFGSGQKLEPVKSIENAAETAGNSETDIDTLMENEEFIETFNSFFYPGSTVIEAKQVQDDENLIFILLESTEVFKDVEDYYKRKKIQSIWSRSEIFEKSSEEAEEEFLDSGNENIPVSKFTYSSTEKDKVANILIKGLEKYRTQIMIIYWNLQ